jgi:hypothetical protein
MGDRAGDKCDSDVGDWGMWADVREEMEWTYECFICGCVVRESFSASAWWTATLKRRQKFGSATIVRVGVGELHDRVTGFARGRMEAVSLVWPGGSRVSDVDSRRLPPLQ